MSTLLLRFAGPLQSWGVGDKFERRGTERAPTKSAVIGMIAAALGRRRNESIADLIPLRFGVRIDQAGTLLRDYHTASHPTEEKRKYITNRYYLADAIFLVGLEGEEPMLTQIDEAIRRPAFPLFLGRRSCPPEGQMSLGIRIGVGLIDALTGEASLRTKPQYKKIPQTILYETHFGEAGTYLQRDNPITFDMAHRRHAFRSVRETMLTDDRSSAIPTDHDPFLDWEGE
jgi:CRISPR system Cascade subunit CasD